MIEDIESSIFKYDRSNEKIKNQFKKMITEVKQRLPNVVAKPALRYSSETWVLRKEGRRRVEASQMKFDGHLVRVTLR